MGRLNIFKAKLKRRLAWDSKSYYSDYIANKAVSPCNEQQVRDILSYNPHSVFEFGCNRGKLLNLLKGKVECHGIDISEPAVEIARQSGLNVDVGDETMLPNIKNFDVVYTSSVLDHIENIDGIVKDFKRIANKAIVIAETNDPVGRFYYPHDYEALGFVNTGFKYVVHTRDHAKLYQIWHWKKPP